MSNVKVNVFGTANGKPLKIQIGDKKFQIANGTHEIDQALWDKIKVAYKDNVRLATGEKEPVKPVVAEPVITPVITPAVEVKVSEEEKKDEVKEPAKRGRPAKKK